MLQHGAPCIPTAIAAVNNATSFAMYVADHKPGMMPEKCKYVADTKRIAINTAAAQPATLVHNPKTSITPITNSSKPSKNKLTSTGINVIILSTGGAAPKNSFIIEK